MKTSAKHFGIAVGP